MSAAPVSLADARARRTRHVRAGEPVGDYYVPPMPDEPEGDISVPAQLRYEDPPVRYGWAAICIGYLALLFSVVAAVHFLLKR